MAIYGEFAMSLDNSMFLSLRVGCRRSWSTAEVTVGSGRSRRTGRYCQERLESLPKPLTLRPM